MEAARWLDPVGGLVISGMIVQAGWQNTKAAVLELADASVDEDVRENAQTAASKYIEEHGATVRAVQGIKSGQNLMFDVEVVVADTWSVADCNAIENGLRETIALQVRGTKRVVIRFTTKQTDSFMDEFISPPKENEDPESHAHHHDHEGVGHSHSSTDLDHKHGDACSNGHVNGTTRKRK